MPLTLGLAETRAVLLVPAPSDELCTDDRRYGRVHMRAWAVVRGTLVLVEVSRLPRPTRLPKQLWLWWDPCPGAG